MGCGDRAKTGEAGYFNKDRGGDTINDAGLGAHYSY